MKIVKAYGCTVSSFTVDGVPYDDLTDEQKKKLEDVIIKNIRREIADGSKSHFDLIDSIYCVDVHYSGTCEQCGDVVTTSTWILDT